MNKMKLSFRLFAVSWPQSVLARQHSANAAASMLYLRQSVPLETTRDAVSALPLSERTGLDLAGPTSDEKSRQRLALLFEFLRVRSLQMTEVVQLPTYARQFIGMGYPQQRPVGFVVNQ